MRKRMGPLEEKNASYLQLVAADVVDDEDVERYGEQYDAGDADDLEGLVKPNRHYRMAMILSTPLHSGF